MKPTYVQRSFEPGIEYAGLLDARDPLRQLRERFYVNPNEIYMDGNSMGLCSVDAEQATLHMLDVWKNNGIRVWNVDDGKYFMYPSYLGSLLAPIIGAEADEVTVTNSTTINIHQALATFYKPVGNKYKILVDDLNFATDRHAVDSQVRLAGYSPDVAVKVVKSVDGRTLDEGSIIDAMTDDVMLALFPSVLYRSAQLLDMERITKAARVRGIIIGWDLCHSIGAVPHKLDEIDADFAIWCTYKYLSAGPGSTAGLYINRRHFDREPGLAGWFGNKKETQFQLNHKHDHAHSADGFLTGTSPLLSMAAIEGVMAIYNDAGIENVREKSLNITAYLMYLIDTRLQEYGYSVGTPREDERRGGHVSLEHKEAYRICLALKDHGVIPDFREPNVVRLAPAALYCTYEETYRLVEMLLDIARNEEYKKYANERSVVV